MSEDVQVCAVGVLGLFMFLHHLVVSLRASSAAGIVESLKLEKTFKVIESDHKKITWERSRGALFLQCFSSCSQVFRGR